VNNNRVVAEAYVEWVSTQSEAAQLRYYQLLDEQRSTWLKRAAIHAVNARWWACK
jgi:hypothetical protein